jgi:uncharacterized protein
MSKAIYVNLPVKDLQASTQFYQALGFTKNDDFSDDNASALMWTESIVFMLIKPEFYYKFTTKTIPDLTKNSSVLLALQLDSKEEVQTFADTAKSLGGSYFVAEPNANLDFMFSYEVTDLDGHTLEPFFMDISKFPTN